MNNQIQENENNLGTILFVDDEVNIAKALLRHFAGLGYNVDVAQSGQDALQILNKKDIDVIVSDMRMPEMDGETLLKEVATKWPDTSRILLTGYADINSIISTVNHGKIDYCLTKPWQDNQIESAIKTSIQAKKLKDKNKDLQQKIAQQNIELQTINDTLKDTVEKRTEELTRTLADIKNNYASMITTCLNLVNLYDPKYINHNKTVAELAVSIAKKLALPEEEINNIYFSGLVYNVGKIGISKLITEKAYKALLPEQKRIFEQYPLLGATALSSIDNSENIVRTILAHRERFNGKGYPHNLSKEDIPFNARILSLAVDFEQLQMGLLLTEKLSKIQAVSYLESYRGIYYDPLIVDTFVDICRLN